VRRHRRIAGRPAAAAHFDEVDDGRTRGIPRGVRVNLFVPLASEMPRGKEELPCQKQQIRHVAG